MTRESPKVLSPQQDTSSTFPSPPHIHSPKARLDAPTLIGLAMTVMHCWASVAQTHTNKLQGGRISAFPIIYQIKADYEWQN